MEKTHSEADQMFSFRELKGKEVFTQNRESKVGVVEDVMIDPHLLEVVAVVTDQSSAVMRDMQMIPSVEVESWGQDAIKVSGAEVIKSGRELPDCEQWMCVSGQLLGQEFVNMSGAHLGDLDDVYFDKQGRITGYKINIHAASQESIPEEMTSSGRFIPVEATHSIGTKRTIINQSRI
jgi:uncharacterized protein YrrD